MNRGCNCTIGRKLGIVAALTAVVASGLYLGDTGVGRVQIDPSVETPPAVSHVQPPAHAENARSRSSTAGYSDSRSAIGRIVTMSCEVAGSHSMQPTLSAQLSQSEMLRLPNRTEPIERRSAALYFCPADFNRDDAIDESDTIDFLDAFSTRGGPFAEFLDINGDGRVDSLDIDAFLHFKEQDCDPRHELLTRTVKC